MEAWPAWQGWRGILDGQHLGTALRAGKLRGFCPAGEHAAGGVGAEHLSRWAAQVGGSPVTSVSHGHPPLGRDVVAAGQAQWCCYQHSHSWGQCGPCGHWPIPAASDVRGSSVRRGWQFRGKRTQIPALLFAVPTLWAGFSAMRSLFPYARNRPNTYFLGV